MTPNRMRAAVFALVAVLATACGSGDMPRPLGEARSVPINPPEPSGVTESTRIPEAHQICRESLRPAAASARVDQIRTRGKLKVGVSQTAFLLSYLDISSGQMRGFEVDVAREIAREIFGPWRTGAEEPIEFVVVSTVDRLSAVRNDEVDMVIATATMTCERRVENDIEFSTEYLRARQGVLVRTDRETTGQITGFADLRDKRVCAGRGTTALRAIVEVGARPVLVIDTGDCLVLLQQGNVEAVSTDDAVLAGFAKQDLTTKLLDERRGDEPYGIVMAEFDTDLVRFVNGVLGRMRVDGTWQRLYDEWLRPALGDALAPIPVYRD